MQSLHVQFCYSLLQVWGFELNPNCLVHKVKKLLSKLLKKFIEWNVDKVNILQKCSFVVCTYISFSSPYFSKKKDQSVLYDGKKCQFLEQFLSPPCYS